MLVLLCAVIILKRMLLHQVNSVGELSQNVVTEKSLQTTSTAMDSNAKENKDTLPKVMSKAIDSYFSLGGVGYDVRVKVGANYLCNKVILLSVQLPYKRMMTAH